MLGRKPVWWLAVPSLGDAWHHNHHAFPASARYGLRWWEIDLARDPSAGRLRRCGDDRILNRLTTES
jgi:hypothetical protein